jgi:hypothetical protein
VNFCGVTASVSTVVMQAKPDQADIVALNEKLTADLATFTGRVTALETQLKQANDAKLKAESDLAEVTKLKGAAESEVTKLKASQSEFDAKVAAEVAKKGISTQAVNQPAAGSKEPSLTEQCLAAKASK